MESTKDKGYELNFQMLMRISDTLEYADYDKDEFDFEIKGWNLNDEAVLIFIDKELYEYGENLKVENIVAKEEHGYYCTRYYDGSDAKDEGFGFWIFFDEYKKGFGKSTNYRVKLKRLNDE